MRELRNADAQWVARNIDNSIVVPGLVKKRIKKETKSIVDGEQVEDDNLSPEERDFQEFLRVWGAADWSDWEDVTVYEEQAVRKITQGAPGEWDEEDARVPRSDWDATPRNMARRANRNKPRSDAMNRDSFLSPIVDIRKVFDVVDPDVDAIEADLRLEMRANQWETQQAFLFAGVLATVPMLVATGVRWFVVEPIFDDIAMRDPESFSLSRRQRIEGAAKVHHHEQRLRFEAGVGRAPPIELDELQLQLRKEAVKIEHEMIEENKEKVENLVSDSVFALAFAAVLVRERRGRSLMFRALNRFWKSGLSETAKAFALITVADILLGYHSEEGWLTLIDLIVRHYGWEVEMEPRYIFTAIVPVTLDAIFKLYLFSTFTKQSPSTVATIREMDRH
ncbi:unnamed protein product [Pedinophyceae sp. YPF-701]|nr:unnamed protein product [Pedinophyceae sp. YPF-701]